MRGDFRLGDWHVQPALCRASRDDRTIHLRAKVMDLLVCLAGHSGQVVSKDDILNEVWKTEFVSESALTRVVTDLRQAFGDDVDHPTVIETIPKRGYRLIMPVGAIPDVVPESSVQPAAAGGPSSVGRRTFAWSRWRALGVAVGLSLGSVTAWVVYKPSPPFPRIETLVVLPFDNLSGDPEQQYFVDGMHGAIVGELSRIWAPGVISRTSAMRYHGSGKSVSEVARELKVDAVVEGSVLRAGDRVRITLQLVDARADRPLWADSFQGDLRDVLALQAEVARAVAREIVGALSPADRPHMDLPARLPNPRRPDAEAYDAYLKGMYYFARFGEESLRTAVRYFESAIRKDPTFARAHAALALALFTPIVEDLPRATLAARTAVDLDPGLPEAHVALGRVRMMEWDHRGSEEAFKRAIDLDPNSSVAHQWYAQFLRETMRLDEALSEARKAAELDPYSLQVRTMVGWVLFNQHRYDEAIDVWADVLELEQEFGLAIYNQGLAYAMQGRGEDVISAARRALAARRRIGEAGGTWLLGVGYALSGDRDRAQGILLQLEARTTNPGTIAVLYHVLGDDDKALDWLEKGYKLRWHGLPNITSEPWFDELRGHPRFRALRAKMQLP